jgi:hypothetical protein
MFSGIHQFPAIFSAGANPFLSVSSISKPQILATTDKVKQAASRFFKYAKNWIAGMDEDEEEEKIAKANFEWELIDEGRTARTMAVSGEGRWLAVTDTQGRVSIIDCVFGHVTRVLKGMRDAQLAWRGSYLLIYAPARDILLVCTIPNGEIFDAVKIEGNGKLLQYSDRELKTHALFIDCNGTVKEIEIKREVKEAEPEVVDDCHFSLHEFR